MAGKMVNDFLKEDLYEILEISLDADEKKIRKSFRKKALECHPDKNPDNPNAAEQFNKLKKILEILLDPGARRAYDKVLKSRKAAAVRARETDLKTQKLKTELEERERAAQHISKSSLSEEERLRREIKRLEDEGEKLIAEELEKVNQEVEAFSRKKDTKFASQSDSSLIAHRIKAKWITTSDWEGYTKEEIEKLFYKWGEISAVVMKSKGKKSTALIEFKDANGANLAAQFERGLSGKPLEVIHCAKPEEQEDRSKDKGVGRSRDFESVSEMNRRRQAEREKIIQEILKNDPRH